MKTSSGRALKVETRGGKMEDKGIENGASVSGGNYPRNDVIYAAPTVETLGDDVSSIRPFASPPRSSPSQQSSSAWPTTPIAPEDSTSYQELRSLSMATPVSSPNATATPHTPNTKRPVRPKQKGEREFQLQQDSMSVSVRTIPVSERTAFACRPAPSLEALTLKSQSKKVSPSPQHLQLIHKLQSVRNIRQMVFSPSVGRSSDILYDGQHRKGRQSMSGTLRDGRYRSIDPVQATLSDLPQTPPLLSNKKHRLPVRADVGFPNADWKDIQKKQQEIAHETEWEEASPRLIVLVTSDDMGTAAIEDDGQGGMQFAGIELEQAKLQNRLHFSQKPSVNAGTIGHQVDSTTNHVRYSMLAPPLDATHSTTMGWRPRPFHDRPPGATYALVCPLQVDFAVGNIEPLLCSLTLYTLNDNKEALVGKASEDFYFPAGEWSGKLDLGSEMPELKAEQEWLQRKHKAIFSYDPLLVRREDMFVVLQVFKVTHMDLAAGYFGGTNRGRETPGNAADRKGWFKRSTKQAAKETPSRGSASQTANRANAVFDSFGTQFLSPLCFGVTPLFSNDHIVETSDCVWPNGQTQSDIPLYAFPSTPESHDDFIQRLHKTVFSAVSNTPKVASSKYTPPIVGSPERTPKRKGVRRFMSPRKTPYKDLSSPTNKSDTTKGDTASVPATVSLFTSSLDADFLDAMLQTPAELIDSSTLDVQKQTSARILVDVSGESAIALDPKQDIDETKKKRSNLVRLPPRPGGYLDTFDFREVLFLQPRKAKEYDIDVPPSYRSLLNLLYIYPKILRLDNAAKPNSRQKTRTKQRYTVRIRLVENTAEERPSSGIVEANNNVLSAFHNPAPWAGQGFLQSVYTRIPVDITSSQLNEYELQAGIPLQDEFKMSLPAVLDSNQFLHFTLFSIDLSDEVDDIANDDVSMDETCGLSAHPIAETSIPLSSSTRDPASGIKATTIIPNGCFRLKLGSFQFHFETRLMSSVHVSDTSVATALRHFPCVSDSFGHGTDARQELALTRNRSGTRNAAEQKEMVSYPSLFESASASAILGHFQPLMFMHMVNLVKNGNIQEEALSEKFLSETMLSFLQICRIVKASLSSSQRGHARLSAFIKEATDAFDEGVIHSSNLRRSSMEDMSEVIPVEPSRSVQSINPHETVDDMKEEATDGGAIRRRKKNTLRSDIDVRITRTFSAMESPDAGFLRTAYGASKTDRMRLEAELDVDVGRSAHLMDDDETVVSFATGLTAEARMAEAREAFEKAKGRDTADESFVNSNEDNPEGLSFAQDFAYRSLSELGLAKRVRSAAQVMLAPCVPPTFFSSPTRNAVVQEEKKFFDESDESPIPELSHDIDDGGIAAPGSDVDDDQQFLARDQDNASPQERSALLIAESTFRSPWQCPVLKFSNFGDATGPIHGALHRGDFVYETILLLWLKAESGDKRKTNSSKGIEAIVDNDSSPRQTHLFNENLDILLPLCLKSIVLRHGEAVEGRSGMARAIMDDAHMHVLQNLVEVLALSLMQRASEGTKAQGDDGALRSALNAADHVLDFLTGLFAVFHPAQMTDLTSTYFGTLRFCETEGRELQRDGGKFEWTKESLHRVKCSRQLRLRGVEKLAVLPGFVAMNYPKRFRNRRAADRYKKASWTTQLSSPTPETTSNPTGDEDILLPRSGWLAELLANECLSICALSCEAVVAEAMAQIESQESKTPSLASALKHRPTAVLKREDLLMFQSVAIHAITCLHELLLRRHAMDRRYQKDSSRERIAALFVFPIFEKSLSSVRWLARMESTHRVRSLWLLCFTYVLQEAPESLLRDVVRSYSQSKDVQIHRFIRLLRLCSSTFQLFIDRPRYCMFPTEIDRGLSPWLLQESFNTVCATTIVVVEECTNQPTTLPEEQKQLAHGILDLLLHFLTTAQSCVTHLRAVGGAIQALEKFGIARFLDTAGGALQHWIRVILSLMNSVPLSVRSIAVDFVVSLLGSTFDMYGNIDELSLIVASVLPEVVAREIALCSVSGHVGNLGDAEQSVWPLRRSFADIEDANPLDDDRVDPQLSPMLSVFCRACQAVIDGVLIEMRLKGGDCDIVGTRMKPLSLDVHTFDADEESLFEAASFFVSETAPMQRIRWLMTLKSLHKAKGQWIEAAETLILCARTISDSIPHLKHVWRASHFPLWSDTRRSLWLSTVGEDVGIPERGNDQVMSFADNFLEPNLLAEAIDSSTGSAKLSQPTVSGMCGLLTSLTKEAVAMYQQEDGMDGLAYSRLESLLKILMGVLEEYTIGGPGKTKIGGIMGRMRQVEEEASLRKVLASISGDMTKLAERMLLIAEAEPRTPKATSSRKGNGSIRQNYFVRVLLSGQKPTRFLESTTLPTFLEWDVPCICRVPKEIFEKALLKSGHDTDRLEENVCSLFGRPIRSALERSGFSGSICLRLGKQVLPETEDPPESITVDVSFVQMKVSERMDPGRRDATFVHQSKHFLFRKPPLANEVISSSFVEMTVATTFPCPLSRQRTLLTTEIVPAE